MQRIMIGRENRAVEEGRISLMMIIDRVRINPEIEELGIKENRVSSLMRKKVMSMMREIKEVRIIKEGVRIGNPNMMISLVKMK
jgi:hypothetical protein